MDISKKIVRILKKSGHVWKKNSAFKKKKSGHILKKYK